MGNLQRLPWATRRRTSRQWQITREEQDSSPPPPEQGGSREEGRFKDEIAPVTIKTRSATVVSEDEYIREGAKVEERRIPPAFDKEGTVTAGNAWHQ